jgi:hypothetical protein
VTYSADIQPTTQNIAVLAALAADNAVLAEAPISVGNHGLLVRRPNDWTAEVVDERRFEDHPRERKGVFSFTSVESLARYVNRFEDMKVCTLGYAHDVTGKGSKVLGADHLAVNYVLDDFLPEFDSTVANRVHRADLVLRPTTAARRWAGALDTFLNQQQMVELVIDGAREIAQPDSADLRDLISDLHAIRTASAKSLVRTSGGLALEVAENVSLHAGTGNLVTIPEQITLVLQPWTAVDDTVVVEVKVRPNVRDDGRVQFLLSAPHLEDRLNEVLTGIHGTLSELVGVEPFWTA